MRKIFTAFAAAALLIGSAHAIPWVVENGSMTASGANIPGWSGLASSTLGRDCGPFNGTVAHQPSINSPFDTAAGSGSLLFTFSAASASLTQQIGLNDAGQNLDQFQVDVCVDNTITSLVIGFYRENLWDVYVGPPAGAIDVISLLTPDTDGTLDTFATVTIPAFTVENNNNPIRIFVGTSNSISGYTGAAAGSKFAIDNVRVGAVSSVESWSLYGY